MLPDIGYARSQAELELGLLLASDPERRSLARDHFELAITELSNLTKAFPNVAVYGKSLDAAIRGRDGTVSADDPGPDQFRITLTDNALTTRDLGRSSQTFTPIKSCMPPGYTSSWGRYCYHWK